MIVVDMRRLCSLQSDSKCNLCVCCGPFFVCHFFYAHSCSSTELFIDAVQATRSVVFFECGWLVDPQQPILGVGESLASVMIFMFCSLIHYACHHFCLGTISRSTHQTKTNAFARWKSCDTTVFHHSLLAW